MKKYTIQDEQLRRIDADHELELRIRALEKYVEHKNRPLHEKFTSKMYSLTGAILPYLAFTAVALLIWVSVMAVLKVLGAQ